MLLARAILSLAALYSALGLVFAAAFITRGVTKLDPAARGSGLLFRLLIVPGAAAFWPILLVKWLKSKEHHA